MPSDRSFSMGQVAASLAGFAQRTGATGFLRWWAAELAPLVPAPARGAVARRRLRPVVAFGGDTATLWRPVSREGAVAMERVVEVPLEGDPAAVAAAGHHAIASIARVAYGGVTGTPRVRIAIPASAVLRRTLALPSAVEENLRQAIGYELDRLTPFKADELYYDAVIASRDASRGTIAVDFAAVRRPVVDAAIAHVAGWGAEVHSVSPDDPSTSSPSRLNLVPDESRVAPAPWKRWQFWAPLAGLALVAAVAVVLPVWQKRDYAIAVINKADAARQQAAVSERLRAELERAAADYHFALERKYAWPPIVRVLDTVTRALPDDTWLTQLEIRTLPKGRERDREIVMRGESANAGRLIPVLEETGIVAQVAPRSPTTKIQPGPGEIFDLGAQLKPMPKPAMVALVGPECPAAEAGGVRAFVPAGVRCTAGGCIPCCIAGGCRNTCRCIAGVGGGSRRRGDERNGGPAGPGCRREASRADACAGACGAQREPSGHDAAAAASRVRPGRAGRRRRSQIRRRSRATQPRPGGRLRNSPCRRSEAMTSAILSRLTPAQARALALGLLVAAVVLVLGVVLAPVLLLHRHYDDAIESWTSRLETYRRVAAQAPELRLALDAMRAKDGRRFFLRNTAPNLAGAELQELVKSAIEGGGGRITTSQSPAPREDGASGRWSRASSSSRRCRTCSASCTRSRRASRISRSRTSRSARPTRSADSSRPPGRSPR
ncbi:MAG: pilus assembly protein PilM [Betaproteobacteria bacterium]|nr:pilus assembly protein PilM [Betaproteobacteria bacterium]